MMAEEAGDPLPFPVTPANVATVRMSGRRLKGTEDKWLFIDCPPNGRVMDEAADCSDLIVVPTTTGPADMVKTFETTDTLGARGFLFAILLTRVLPAPSASNSPSVSLRIATLATLTIRFLAARA